MELSFINSLVRCNGQCVKYLQIESSFRETKRQSGALKDRNATITYRRDMFYNGNEFRASPIRHCLRCFYMDFITVLLALPCPRCNKVDIIITTDYFRWTLRATLNVPQNVPAKQPLEFPSSSLRGILLRGKGIQLQTFRKRKCLQPLKESNVIRSSKGLRTRKYAFNELVI